MSMTVSTRRVANLAILVCALGTTSAMADALGASPIEQRLAALESTVVSLQQQLDANAALLPYVTVVDDEINGVAGPHFIIEGANVHVRSGAGSTAEGCDGVNFECATRTGLGNLIVGYNEPREDFFPPYDCENDPDAVDAEGVARCTKRTGAHHLIVGLGNNFIGHGGAVMAIFSEARGSHTTVTGGFANNAQGPYASVSGGSNNFATAREASVSGGALNRAESRAASVSGGVSNLAAGVGSSVSAGEANAAFGYGSSVSGGVIGQAHGTFSSVSGGDDNKAFGFAASVTGGINNTASGDQSSITGGLLNAATGWNTVILGGGEKTAATGGCVVGESGTDC